MWCIVRKARKSGRWVEDVIVKGIGTPEEAHEWADRLNNKVVDGTLYFAEVM